MTETAPFDAAPTPETPPAAPANGARLAGSEKDFWKLLTRGAFLLLVTLGIYRFWLATDVRRYLWNNTEIAGEGLEYVGTARELLIGFLIAIAFLVALWLSGRLAKQAGLNQEAVTNLGIYCALAAIGGAKLMMIVVDFNDRHAFNERPGYRSSSEELEIVLSGAMSAAADAIQALDPKS